MPSEQEVKKVENAVKVAVAENEKLSEQNSDSEVNNLSQRKAYSQDSEGNLIIRI